MIGRIEQLDEVDMAEYLFSRLYQLGVRGVHGVPGDYNLVALDYIEPAGLQWVGNANELNAGYAADGYARIKGVSALVTAFGVGELSALNAIGGAYAERAPVVHIVGVPSTTVQQRRLNMHHSLGNGDFRVNARVYKEFTCAQVNLQDATAAPAFIDETLRQCLLQRRPVYIELPTDMVNVKVPASRLLEPISLFIPKNDQFTESAAADHILQHMYAAKQPLLVVDGWTATYGVSEEANELVRETGFPTSTTTFGKGIVNEGYPNFHGVYTGRAGGLSHMSWVQSCDLVIRIAPLNDDFNTCGFSTLTKPSVTIEMYQDAVDVCGALYRNLDIKGLFKRLLTRLEKSKLPRLEPYPDLGNPLKERDELPVPEPDGIINQSEFWKRISTFFRPGDIVMTETGTCSSGARECVLPPQTTLINSVIWMSIGYMLPACAGAALAQREMVAEGMRPESGRTILFEGDGSFQMTAQAISDIIRNRLDVTIFVINNDGYTIERFINGMEAGYNWIQPWRYVESARYFGAPENDPEYPVFAKRAATWGELMKILNDRQFQSGKGFNMIEVVMDKEDAPSTLKRMLRMK